MKLQLSTAKALHTLSKEKSISSSSIKDKVLAKKLTEEGILMRTVIGRTKGKFTLASKDNLQKYLQNNYQIPDLKLYIDFLEKEMVTAKDGVDAGSDSKLRKTRNLKGFIANCILPIKAWMNDQPTVLYPQAGFLIYVQDFERFKIEPDAIVIGVENPEHVVNLQSAANLFKNEKILFVSRYPQSKDLIKWLQQIHNNYLHFGDFDLKGIAIYQDEFKKYLSSRAVFFIPPDIQKIIREHGSRKLYNQQINTSLKLSELEDPVKELVKIIHQERKGIEQQFFL